MQRSLHFLNTDRVSSPLLHYLSCRRQRIIRRGLDRLNKLSPFFYKFGREMIGWGGARRIAGTVHKSEMAAEIRFLVTWTTFNKKISG